MKTLKNYYLSEDKIMDYIKRSYELLKDWKKDSYIVGVGCLDEVGPVAARYGKML